MERVVLFGLAKRNARKGIPAHPEKVGNILVALAFVDQARRGASIASLGRARHGPGEWIEAAAIPRSPPRSNALAAVTIAARGPARGGGYGIAASRVGADLPRASRPAPVALRVPRTRKTYP